MRKHIFMLGLILTSIYTTTAMAWPTKEATGIWTNSTHTALANMRCGDCCKTDCWLPTGTYYDDKGKFSRTCGYEPSDPGCDPNKTYSVVNGQCVASCPNAHYYYGGYCIDPNIDGMDYSYNGYDGARIHLDETNEWGVDFGTWVVRGQSANIDLSDESCVDEDTGTYRIEGCTTGVTPGAYDGDFCWCRLYGPMDTWILLSESEECSYACAERFMEEVDFRRKLLEVATRVFY